jgi:lysophospholipase L1-like esterase
MKLFRYLALGLLVSQCYGQVPISASSITDSFGHPIAVAKLCFVPVDATKTPAGFRVGSTQVVPNEACGNVAAGVLQSGLTVVPTTSNINYHVYLKQSFSNATIRDYGATPITSAWSLDNFDPTVSSQLVVSPPISQGVGVPSSCSSPSVWLRTDISAIYTCQAGVYVSVSLAGATGPAGPQGLVSLSQVDAEINTFLGGSSGTTTNTPFGTNGAASQSVLGSGIFAVNPGAVAPQTGALSSVKLNVTAVGGALEVLVYNVTSAAGTPVYSQTYALVDHFNVTPTATGEQTFVAGSDYAARNITAGQVLGVYSNSAATGSYIGAGGGGPGIWYGSGDPASNPWTGFLGGGYLDISGVVTVTAAGTPATPVTTATLNTAVTSAVSSALVPTNPVTSPWLGKKWVNFGDSYSANFGSVWQSAVASDLRMPLYAQYAAGGRTLSQNNSGNWIFSDFYTSGAFDQTKLATALTGVDVITIALGTNDASSISHSGYPLGSPSDASSVRSWCGDIKFALDAIYKANPTARVFWVSPIHITPAPGTPYISGDFANWYDDATADSMIVAAKTVFGSYGVPVIDMAHNVGINEWNVSHPDGTSFMLRDKLHPTDSAFTKYYAPLIARGLLAAPII